MKLHHLTVEEAFESLKSSPHGLTSREAARRLVEYGPNHVRGQQPRPLPIRFLQEFTHFFAIILWLAAAIAFVAETYDPGHGMVTLGAAIIGVILINGTFSFVQEYRAEHAFKALQELLPPRCKVIRDGETTLIASGDIVPGDLIDLQEGDSIAADARVIQAYGLRVNNSTVTGESVPHSRDAAPHPDGEMIDSRNTLLAGTNVVSGEGRALVFATGAHSTFGEIARMAQEPRERDSPLQREIAYLSRLVAILALALGTIFYLIGQAMGLSFWHNLIFAIGIIVANVPEGLLPTMTLALAMGAQRMARRNALVRHLPTVETLGSTTVICTDKTGTLTMNRMTVKRIFVGRLIENEDSPDFRALAGSHSGLIEVARYCHTLRRTGEAGQRRLLGDPMEIALVEMAEHAAPNATSWLQIGEVPFDSQRRRLSTAHQSPAGAVLLTKGAPEVVLDLCKYVDAAASVAPFTEGLRQEYAAAHKAMAESGLRVLAMASRPLESTGNLATAESNLTLHGLIGLEDPPRPEVPAAIRQCREAGIKVIMITGDHPNTAVEIGREIGLIQTDSPSVITGDRLRHLSRIQLQLALDAPEILFARVTADQKMRIVSALKRKGEIVAVTGDGVNDAPALKKADIGIAMGRDGTDVARESADLILLDDNFATIVAAVEEGRTVFANIRKFLTYILTSNIPELVPYLAFVLFRIPLPLTIIQILAVDLGTDMLPALALGAEPPDRGLMRQPPRRRTDRLLKRGLILRAYLWLGCMQAVAALSAFFFVLRTGGWQFGEPLDSDDPLYLAATTACLSAIIVMQIANVFVCRNDRESTFRRGIFQNRLMLLGIAAELVLIVIIVYTTPGNLVFGTAPIGAPVWLFVLPFAAALVALEEMRKWIVRSRNASHRNAIHSLRHAPKGI